MQVASISFSMKQTNKSYHGGIPVIGFEKMEGGLSERYTDRISPVGRHMDHMVAMGADPAVIQPRMNRMTSDVIKLFAYAAREYMGLYPQVKCSLACPQYLRNRVVPPPKKKKEKKKRTCNKKSHWSKIRKYMMLMKNQMVSLKSW